MSGPASYVNRFYIHINSDGITRVTFMEKLEGVEFERAAAAMTVADARRSQSAFWTPSNGHNLPRMAGSERLRERRWPAGWNK